MCACRSRRTSAGERSSSSAAPASPGNPELARVLIVGCGCRGGELAAALVAEGHSVRGTTREPDRLAAIDATGAEAVVADPDRLSTLMPRIEGVSVVCWLMGGAVGDPELVAALHGPRLETLLERLVDTPVRGFVYEAAGRVERRHLDSGADVARRAAERHRIPVELLEEDPVRPAAWLSAARAGVARVLERPGPPPPVARS